MNWSEMQANWPELKAVVQAHWPMLTEDVLDNISGDRRALARAIECHYGLSAVEAETAICEFEKDVRWPGAVK
jgi:hypothetical protein